MKPQSNNHKTNIQLVTQLPVLALLFVAASSYATSITGVDFKMGSPKARVEISLDRPTEFEKTYSEGDKQVIIDIKDTTIPLQFARTTDASQFATKLALISARQKDNGTDTRIVLQMKNPGDVEVTQEGTKIVALVDATGEDQSSASTTASAGADASDASTSTEAAKPTSASNSDAVSVSVETSNVASHADTLESFVEAQSNKKYVGSKVSIQMKDADLQDIFRIIANASEFNIILADTVKGKMSLDLADVPWDQVLDIVLKANKLSAERIANILRVVPQEEYQRERDIENQARVSAEAAEPLISKIFPISYADPTDVKKILTAYLSRDPRLPASAPGAVRGSIESDRRTNSLVIRETPTTIEKFKRLIRELDTQTPQVLIEGKFIQVSEVHARAFEGSLYGTTRTNEGGTFTFHPGNNNFGATFGGAKGISLGAVPPALGLTGVTGGMALGFSPKAAIIPGLPDLQALISITATDRESKVIASPRVVTQNRQTAQIQSGQTVLLATSGGVGTAGGYQTVQAVLNLSVEPQVTNDGGINLRIQFSQTTPTTSGSTTQATFNTSSVNTNVLVDSGSTLVLGGVYNSNVVHEEAGIPFLRDIPVLGVLFGSKSDFVEKTELFIFISPRVLNEKESGLRT